MKTSLIALFATVTLPFIASADIPPPPGYVEQCTVAKQCGADEVGSTCGTYHGEPDKCDKLYSGTAFTRKCRTRGASVWSEVWCAPKGTPDPAKPQPLKPEPKKPEPTPVPG